MKYLLLVFLLSSPMTFAQNSLPTSPVLPSEESEVVPELVRPEESPFEKAVDEAPPVGEREQQKKSPQISAQLSTRENRGTSTGTVMVGYQLITSWLPSKKTLSYSHIFSENWTLEGEYSFQTIDTPFIGVDLGEIKERRFTLHARRYVGNSFHFSFGGVLSDFRAKVGSDILDQFGTEISSSFSAQNIGVTGGIGNRWQWSNGITLGIDWFRLNIPVIQTRVEDNVLDDLPGGEDREDIKDVIKTFNRIPTFVLLGLNLGYTF